MSVLVPKSSAQKLGFTLIELLVVMAILGVLSVVLLMAVNPVEQLAKTRDSGRVSSVTQLGHAVAAFYTTRSEAYPAPNQWNQDLVSVGELPSFPAGIPYTAYGVSACTTYVQPAVDATYCYSLDEGGNGFGAIVFAKMESQTQLSKCSLIGDTYFVFSTADGKGGIICASGDPTPWAAGSMPYLD